jgi:GTP-binding protein HflX
MTRELHATRTPRERFVLCGVLFPDQVVEQEGELTEARGLVEAAGGDVVGDGIIQRRDRPVAATLMGSGKVEEVFDEVRAHKPDGVVVDNDLTPAQGRNLEKAWNVRVIDRSELILDIFARRARTGQARLQVELAQTEYLLPRLKRMWTHLERMEGAIGARGPGETQLETDRRLIRKRISDLKKQLKQIEKRKMREVSSRHDEYTIGLVGYTNAGKSTLLNRLTGAGEYAADLLFATLDTRTRQWALSDGRTALLSDTVGFLSRLPHHLVASFHATLEETLHADLLLHVADASHADAVEQIRAVDEVLAELSQGVRDTVLVFNKIDAVGDPIELTWLRADREEDSLFLSAKTGEGVEDLDRLVQQRIDLRSAKVHVLVPLADGRTIARMREAGVVLREDVCEDDSKLSMELKVDDAALGNLRRSLPSDVHLEVVEPAAEPREPAGLD